jgi:hypothetical protein
MGNGTRDLLGCNIVPQPTTLLRADLPKVNPNIMFPAPALSSK